MTKISKKTAYPIKTPVKSDYFVGTDSEDNLKTVNFNFEYATRVVNEFNGQSLIGYQFKTSTNIPLDVLNEAEFYSLGNETTISELTKLYVNKFTKNDINLTNLYNYLLINSNDFLFKLQGADPNVYVYFNLTSLENFSDYYVFNVTVYKANAALTELLNFGEYIFNFELKAGEGAVVSDPLKLDKSTYTGNAQDLDDRLDILENYSDVSNTFIVRPTYSLTSNILTIGALGQWRLNGIVYSNPVSVNFPITLAATGRTRLDYFVPNTSNGFTKISGLETLSLAIPPALPNEGMYVTYVLVSDSSVGSPVTPPAITYPTIDQVLRSGFSTTRFIWFFNNINSFCTRFSSTEILFQKLESVFNYIRSDNTTQSYVAQMPNKLGGSEQTFAMVSDLNGGNFIPLSGTTVGNNVTGNIQVNNGIKIAHNAGSTESSIFFGASLARLVTYDTTNFSYLTLTPTGLLLSSNASGSKGFSGFGDYSANITNLDYTQKIYVDTKVNAKQNQLIAGANINIDVTNPLAPVISATGNITVRKIATNTILADSDNDTVILLTASATVTLPNGLVSGFNVAFATQAGATLTYSLGGLVVLINNSGTSMSPLSTHTIVNTGVANEYLTVGL